jgi:hypothetical protein
VSRFKVLRKDGTEVVEGDLLYIRHQHNAKWKFQSCTHPRKVHVTWKEDPNGPDYHPNMASREFYASVFDVSIWDDDAKEWTFPLS